MAEIYQVMLIPRPTVAISDVIAELDKAIDWFQVSEYCFVLQASLSAARWSARLQKLCKPEGELLVAKMDPDDNHGWMPQQFWDWLAQRVPKPENGQADIHVDGRPHT